jgi:DNA-binding NarL/FixJ family response regulator
VITALIVEDLHETGEWLKGLVSRAFKNADVHLVSTISEASDFLSSTKVGMALIDINLPDGNGIDFVSSVRKQSPETYAVIVTIYDDPEHLFPALRAGAHGYLLKDQSEDLLISQLNGILTGDPPLSPGIARKILEHFHAPVAAEHEQLNALETNAKLTPREEEVLVLVARGLSRKEIAQILELSIHTIARYIKDLYLKLDVNSRAEAAIFACRMGLIQMQ